MFGLSQQIGGAEFAIHCFIGNDKGFGRTGKQINADTPVKLALGFGDKGIARTHQHINRLDALCAKRHGRDSLHTPQNQNFIRATQMHGRNNGGMRAALMGRGRGNHAFDTGDLGGHDAHMRGGNHRIATTRHIAPDR